MTVNTNCDEDYLNSMTHSALEVCYDNALYKFTFDIFDIDI